MVVLTQKHLVAGAQVRGASSAATRPARSSVAAPARALFGWGEKKEKSWREIEREEQIRVQQEVLARRRSNSWQGEVKERRAKVSRYMRDPDFKKEIDAEKRKRFQEKMAAEPPVPKFGIIVPLIPIGLPDYDIGEERFDLRLPYVDNGWVDEEADFGKQIGRFFGLGGKKKAAGDDKKGSGKKGGKK